MSLASRLWYTLASRPQRERERERERETVEPFPGTPSHLLAYNLTYSRILAVSTGKRLEAGPDMPTMTELGIPMDLTGWWAAMLPAGAPKPVVDKIHQWFVQMVSTPETKKFLNSFGGDPYIEKPEVAQARYLQEIKAWGEYVRIAKIEPQ